jgi:hypothetical protein
MTSAFASFSRRSFFLFSLALALFQTSCGDPCGGPRPPSICTASLFVLADLPADQRPTVTPVGTTNTGFCGPSTSAGAYSCSVVIEGRQPGTTLDVTVAAPGATPQTVTLIFGAPFSSACWSCVTYEPVPAIDLRPTAVDAGLPPIAS